MIYEERGIRIKEGMLLHICLSQLELAFLSWETNRKSSAQFQDYAERYVSLVGLMIDRTRMVSSRLHPTLHIPQFIAEASWGSLPLILHRHP